MNNFSKTPIKPTMNTNTKSMEARVMRDLRARKWLEYGTTVIESKEPRKPRNSTKKTKKVKMVWRKKNQIVPQVAPKIPRSVPVVSTKAPVARRRGRKVWRKKTPVVPQVIPVVQEVAPMAPGLAYINARFSLGKATSDATDAKIVAAKTSAKDLTDRLVKDPVHLDLTPLVPRTVYLTAVQPKESSAIINKILSLSPHVDQQADSFAILINEAVRRKSDDDRLSILGEIHEWIRLGAFNHPRNDHLRKSAINFSLGCVFEHRL